MAFRQKKRKQPKPQTKEVQFRFFNGGIQYICLITSPVTVENYRLKEVFDNTFVGLKETQISILQTYTNFKRLHKDITFEVKTVKEYEECQMQK